MSMRRRRRWHERLSIGWTWHRGLWAQVAGNRRGGGFWRRWYLRKTRNRR
jgi:hypothetical protein